MSNQQRPLIVIIAGPNGSGKTTFTNQLLDHPWVKNTHYINADIIAREQYGDWNSQKAVLSAAREAERQRESCLANGRDFTFETVFSTDRHLDLMERAKAAGFFIRFYFISTKNPQINISRVAKRVRHGGHDVPEEKTIKRYKRSMANLTRAFEKVDRGYVWDNSVDDQPYRPIFRTRNGVLAKIYQGQMPDWCADAIKSLRDSSQ